MRNRGRRNQALALRPNDTLVAAALTEYLVLKRCRFVSYGLSSIQTVNNTAGLHIFKTKLGFEAKPVHRAFVAHPLLRPFANSVTQQCVRVMLTLVPRNRGLKKCDGVLSTMLEKNAHLRPELETPGYMFRRHSRCARWWRPLRCSLSLPSGSL